MSTIATPAFAVISGTLDYDDCEYFQACHGDNNGSGGVTSSTLTCTGGYALISHACSHAGASTSSSAVNVLQCLLTGVDSLFVQGYQNGSNANHTCGSIKCCAVN